VGKQGSRDTTRVGRGQEAGTRSLKKAGKTSNPFGEWGDEWEK